MKLLGGIFTVEILNSLAPFSSSRASSTSRSIQQLTPLPQVAPHLGTEPCTAAAVGVLRLRPASSPACSGERPLGTCSAASKQARRNQPGRHH